MHTRAQMACPFCEQVSVDMRHIVACSVGDVRKLMEREDLNPAELVKFLKILSLAVAYDLALQKDRAKMKMCHSCYRFVYARLVPHWCLKCKSQAMTSVKPFVKKLFRI